MTAIASLTPNSDTDQTDSQLESSMGKVRNTKCEICLKKFRGKVGVLSHYRMIHPYEIYVKQKSQEYEEKYLDEKFLKEHEKTTIPYNHRMATLGYIENKDDTFLAILVEWEKAQLREIAYKHPIFKNWKFRYPNPFSRAIEVFYEAIGFFACEYMDSYLKNQEIDNNTDIDVVIDKILSHDYERDFFRQYYNRKYWMWSDTNQSTDRRMHRFIKFILSTSQTRVLTAVKIRIGDGVWLLGKAIRYGPKNIIQHMAKYVDKEYLKLCEIKASQIDSRYSN